MLDMVRLVVSCEVLPLQVYRVIFQVFRCGCEYVPWLKLPRMCPEMFISIHAAILT